MCEEMRAWAERIELGFKGKQASWETIASRGCRMRASAGTGAVVGQEVSERAVCRTFKSKS